MQIPDGKGSNLIDIPAPHGNCQKLFFQTHAPALPAGCDPHKGLILLLHGLGKSLFVPPFHTVDQALKSHRIDPCPLLSLVVYLHFFSVRAVDNDLFHLLRVFFKRRVQIEMILLSQSRKQRVGEAALVPAGLPAHHRNGPLADAQSLVGYHQIQVKFHLIPQTGAHRAGPERIVKGKTPGFNLADAHPAVRTGKTLAEGKGFPADDIHHQKPLRQLQHILNGIRQTALNTRLYRQTVHHYINIVFDVLLQGDVFRELIETAVHPHPDIAALPGSVQNLGVFPLAPPDHRGQKLQLGALRQFHNLIHHLVHGLPGNLPAALRTMGNADPGIEKTEIVIDLRHRSHCGAGVAVGGLLVDGDGGGKALNLVHVGFFHLSQKHPRIGGQRLHIAPLSLRVDGVKGQGRFAGSRHSRQHHQLIPGNVHINALQIVLPGSPYFDIFHLLDFFHNKVFLLLVLLPVFL